MLWFFFLASSSSFLITKWWIKQEVQQFTTTAEILTANIENFVNSFFADYIHAWEIFRILYLIEEGVETIPLILGTKVLNWSIDLYTEIMGADGTYKWK